MGSVQPIVFQDDRLFLLDQRVLPREKAWVECRTSKDVAEAVRNMVIRGAPGLSIAAAYGMALAHRGGEDLEQARAVLLASRPTAVNLRWALERVCARDPSAYAAEAAEIHQEDLRINRALGDHGAALLPPDPVVYHHCNTGALATGGWGTALGVIRSVHAEGRGIHVYVGETRPYLQGARLTAWECAEEGIDCTLVCDSAAATVLPRCDAVLVGADRVAANGDVANKIGTLGLAILARHHGVAFYVCMPMSTLDLRCPDGAAIPIEERDPSEVRGHGGLVWAPDVPVFNPGFDVTPAGLVTGYVTERGLLSAPFTAGLDGGSPS